MVIRPLRKAVSLGSERTLSARETGTGASAGAAISVNDCVALNSRESIALIDDNDNRSNCGDGCGCGDDRRGCSRGRWPYTPAAACRTVGRAVGTG